MTTEGIDLYPKHEQRKVSSISFCFGYQHAGSVKLTMMGVPWCS